MNTGEFEITCMTTKDAATAVIHTTDGRLGEGSAKRHPTDKPKPLVGQALAIARALEDLADKYHKAAKKHSKTK